MLQRYFLEFSYHGARYFGWQIQPNAASVQQEIQEKLSLLLQKEIEIVGAGRTDTGVHAKQMFAHLDAEKDLTNPNFIKRLNSFLPKDISIHQIHLVPNDAHARFDATHRTYEYWIHQFKNPFLDGLSWHVVKELDLDKMNEAGKILMQYDDFKCFSKTHTDVKTFFCKVSVCKWQKHEDKLVFTIQADRFLRNMVRAIVGTMMDIGTHKIPVEQMHDIIQSKNRGKAGFSVPAHGLYLTQVTYPYI
ncbi:MAG: tRNA pseudouridine(38-40) synthase TruA [Flavobacterium sp.]